MRGNNVLLSILRKMKGPPELRMVSDQIGAPTWCCDVAEATAQVLRQIGSPRCQTETHALWGIYHMSNGGEISWHGLAEAIQALEGSNEPHQTARLVSIPSREYPAPALRPLNSRLNNDKLERTFGIRLQDWRMALTQCLAVG